MSDSWSARCDTLLGEAERDLVAAVGDSSLCAISKQGERVDGVKYLEGRTAALREIRRALERPSADDAHRTALQKWQEQLELAREREMGADWIAYRSGGVDALVDLVGPAADR